MVLTAIAEGRGRKMGGKTNKKRDQEKADMEAIYGRFPVKSKLGKCLERGHVSLFQGLRPGSTERKRPAAVNSTCSKPPCHIHTRSVLQHSSAKRQTKVNTPFSLCGNVLKSEFHPFPAIPQNRSIYRAPSQGCSHSVSCSALMGLGYTMCWLDGAYCVLL